MLRIAVEAAKAPAPGRFECWGRDMTVLEAIDSLARRCVICLWAYGRPALTTLLPVAGPPYARAANGEVCRLGQAYGASWAEAGLRLAHYVYHPLTVPPAQRPTFFDTVPRLDRVLPDATRIAKADALLTREGANALDAILHDPLLWRAPGLAAPGAFGAKPAADPSPQQVAPTDGTVQDSRIWLKGKAYRFTPGLRELLNFLLSNPGVAEQKVIHHFGWASSSHLHKRLCDLRGKLAVELKRSGWRLCIKVDETCIYCRWESQG
jgi:hypothetical protein